MTAKPNKNISEPEPLKPGNRLIDRKPKQKKGKKDNLKIVIISCTGLLALALLLIFWNTLHVGHVISSCDIELIPLNSKLSDIDSIFKYHADTTQQLMLYKVDAADLQQHMLKLNQSVNQLKEQKRGMLDANAISFLFQLLSILLIAIGLYLLQQINKLVNQNKKASEHLTRKIEKQKRNSKRIEKELTQKSVDLDRSIKTRQVINYLFSSCQVIQHCTLFLKKEPKKRVRYDPKNLRFCYNISRECMAIQDRIKRLSTKQEWQVTKNVDMDLLLGLLEEARIQFERLQLPQAGKHYEGVYREINQTINCLKGKSAC